jgi:hypothetical protein
MAFFVLMFRNRSGVQGSRVQGSEVQGSAQSPAKKTAGQMEKETDERRIRRGGL